MGGGSAIPVIVDLCCGTGALGLAVAAGLTVSGGASGTASGGWAGERGRNRLA